MVRSEAPTYLQAVAWNIGAACRCCSRRPHCLCMCGGGHVTSTQSHVQYSLPSKLHVLQFISPCSSCRFRPCTGRNWNKTRHVEAAKGCRGNTGHALLGLGIIMLGGSEGTEAHQLALTKSQAVVKVTDATNRGVPLRTFGRSWIWRRSTWSTRIGRSSPQCFHSVLCIVWPLL